MDLSVFVFQHIEHGGFAAIIQGVKFCENVALGCWGIGVAQQVIGVCAQASRNVQQDSEVWIPLAAFVSADSA